MDDQDSHDYLPSPPSFTEEEMRKCKETGDYMPVMFEWYKFVGQLNAVVAHIQRDSPAFKSIPERHYFVLVGLLNRCARLTLSNVALSHEGRFGETTAIIDRCIFESGIKIAWLCTNPSDEKFTRYLADGLKTELELRTKIDANIALRNGQVFPIETRMLKSIAKHVASTGLTESDISKAGKLPDLASMLSVIGMDRLIYVVAQKIGSHHIHGTWPSLLFHYLTEEPSGSGEFVPRGHDCGTHINQLMFVPMIMLRAMSDYIEYAFEEREDAKAFISLFDSTRDELMGVYTEAFGGDLAA